MRHDRVRATRGLVAVLDDRAAIEQADRLGLQSVGAMWIVVEAYKSLWEPREEGGHFKARQSGDLRTAGESPWV